MKFQVPQFIEIEDKVIGPFSFKQFVYIGGGAGICFVLLRILPTFIAVIAILPVALFSLGLAFKKVNNRPLINMVESFFKYMASSRLYIWKRVDTPAQSQNSRIAENYLRLEVPKLGQSRLKDMNWQLDARKGEDEK